MPFPSQIAATDLLFAFRSVAAVLADHAGALDALQADDDAEFEELSSPAQPSEQGAAASAFASRTPLAGTDLAVTFGAAVTSAEGSTDMAHLFEALRRGALTGATGPAGQTLANLLAGLAEVLCNLDYLDGAGLALGLEVAAERLAPSDGGKRAGSMPAVVAASALAALRAVDDGADLADVVILAADEGLAELETGPRSNPDLVERGVVDAGAAGFLLILDTLASVLTGEPLPAPPSGTPALVSGGQKFLVRCEVIAHAGCGIESANWLETAWHELGSLRFFDGIGPIWKAELLTTLPGEAVEAIFEVGRPKNLHIGLKSETA